MRIYREKIAPLLVTGVLLLASACGSSGDSTSPNASAATEITGSVFAAPVNGAAVIVKDANGNTIAGPVSTASDGTYHVNVPTSALASDLRIESGAGTFIDEATGTETTAGTLAAFITGGTLTTGSVHIDPSSTIIHALVTGSSKTHGEANRIFDAAFGYTPDTSVAPKNGPTSGSDAPQRLAALRAMAFSQMTKDLGLSPWQQFDLLVAISQDLEDGALDSKNAEGPVPLGTGMMPEDIENRFEGALMSVLTNTTCNMTALTIDQIGELPFSKVALTPTYRIEYLPMGIMSATVGKTMFKIKITDRTTAAPVTGLTISLMPLMYMSTKNHMTPVGSIVDNGDGTYTCTVYYLMASGPGMGVWELKVMIGSGLTGESAIFYPKIGMTMGDTVKFNLNGQADIITGITGTEKRTYILFNDGLVSGATTTLNIFIATREDMMHFPPVSGGTVLSSPTGTWSVDSARTSLLASSDSTFTTSVAAVDSGNGHWSLPGISWLSTGTTGTVYLKFTVNDEVKTAGIGTTSPGYATITVTPK